MECVKYANQYFDSKVMGNGNQWYDNSKTTQVSIQSGCVACWSGGKDGYGHVGVVESWDSDSKTMTYSDANRINGGGVDTKTDYSERDMKRLFGPSYTFQGYVIPD